MTEEGKQIESTDDLRLDNLQKMLVYHQEELALQQEYIDGIIFEIVAIQKSRVSGEPDRGDCPIVKI